MSKKIYEFRNGEITAKYTVVYENKTRYYCKVNGTDQLDFFLKKSVKEPIPGIKGFPNYHDCVLVTEDQNSKEKFKESLELAKFKRLLIQMLDDLQATCVKIKEFENAISNYTGRINNLKAYQKDLIAEIGKRGEDFKGIWNSLSPQQKQTLNEILHEGLNE